MTLCLRYVATRNDQLVLKESFLSFCIVEQKTGAAGGIIEVLRDEGIVVTDMRGQGYDGCSAMKGAVKGVQAEIKKIIPQALCFQYSSHRLNLALAHSVQQATVKLTVGTIASICSFISASSHRVKLLQDMVESSLPTSKVRRLKPLCATRWEESHEAFITFEQLFIPIVETVGN